MSSRAPIALALVVAVSVLACVRAGWTLAGEPHTTYLPFVDPGEASL